MPGSWAMLSPAVVDSPNTVLTNNPYRMFPVVSAPHRAACRPRYGSRAANFPSANQIDGDVARGALNASHALALELGQHLQDTGLVPGVAHDL